MVSIQSWAVAALADNGIAASGDLVTYATQPWSTVWTVRGGGERFWLKSSVACYAREGELQTVLARLAPDQVDMPVAVEPTLGWFLTRDGGTTLLRSRPDIRTFEVDTLVSVLTDYARLQRATLGAKAELLRAGLPEFEVLAAATTASSQAERLRTLPDDDPRRLPDEHVERVLAALPALEEASRALAEGPVPAALDHGDLWPGNVFPPCSTRGYRFFDFADATWGHPFTSLVMLAAECVYQWRIPQPQNAIELRDERVRAVFDAYLTPWTDFAALDSLRELLSYALRVAPVLRTAAWLRNLETATGPDLASHAGMAWAWLEDVTKPVLL